VTSASPISAPHADMLDVGRRLGYRRRRLEEPCPDETVFALHRSRLAGVRRLRWESPRRADELPRHPYRDTAIAYAVLAGLVVVIALATGGSLVRTLVTAAIVYVVATAWSWRRWRNRLRARAARKQDAA
jgi:hypothetical protein